MREQIRITVALDYDADAERTPAEQCADVLEDVGRLLDPDAETGVELIAATLAKHESESQIYSGTARNAFTRSGFKAFTVARCAEWKDSHCARIGWQSHFPDGKPDSVFWTVYGFRVGRGSEAVGDFKTRASALCMADALADGRAVDCDDSALPPFCVTWETVTEESAEHGDADARGFVRADNGAREPLDPARLDPGGDLYNMTLRDALEALEDCPGTLEALEPSASDHGAARWITAHYRRDDCGAGDVIAESLSLHLPDSITPASRARLVRFICKR